MNPEPTFTSVSRQQFRRYFQPSRILLGLIPAPNKTGLNIITLCFSMYCSYKPPMLAVAIQNINASYDLIKAAKEYVLCVPGPNLADETLKCGLESDSEVDKVKAFKMRLIRSEKIGVPALRDAIANIEIVKEDELLTGDHILVVGRAVNFRVNAESGALPLLSVGPDTTGYSVLVRSGIHRIGTVKRSMTGRRVSPEGPNMP